MLRTLHALSLVAAFLCAVCTPTAAVGMQTSHTLLSSSVLVTFPSINSDDQDDLTDGHHDRWHGVTEVPGVIGLMTPAVHSRRAFPREQKGTTVGHCCSMRRDRAPPRVTVSVLCKVNERFVVNDE